MFDSFLDRFTGLRPHEQGMFVLGTIMLAAFIVFFVVGILYHICNWLYACCESGPAVKHLLAAIDDHASWQMQPTTISWNGGVSFVAYRQSPTAPGKRLRIAFNDLKEPCINAMDCGHNNNAVINQNFFYALRGLERRRVQNAVRRLWRALAERAVLATISDHPKG